MSTLELPRSRASIAIERDLNFDPLFFRHVDTIARSLKAFRPDLIHITGPSELGIIGAYFAWKLGIPLAASWHTNVHEYAAKRIGQLMAGLPERHLGRFERKVERASLWATSRFYRLAKVLFAPNDELCSMLEEATGKPVYLMQRGVDTDLFTPARRDRIPSDNAFVLGYVGRLSIEKNVLLLPLIEAELERRSIADIRFLIVGQGNEEASLRARLRHASFAGVLRGEDLARAYARMDLLVFPSHTDTFGNVVLEALASGVPALVTPSGGPKYIVRHGETGYVIREEEFASRIAHLVRNPTRLETMRTAATSYALDCSWDAVFSRLYGAYRSVLPAVFAAGQVGDLPA